MTLTYLTGFDPVDALPDPPEPDFLTADGSGLLVSNPFPAFPGDTVGAVQLIYASTSLPSAPMRQVGLDEFGGLDFGALPFDPGATLGKAVPVGVDGQTFVVPINPFVPSDFDPAFEVAAPGLAYISVASGAPEVIGTQILDFGGGRSEDQSIREIVPLADGRLQVLVEAAFSGGVEPGLISAILGAPDMSGEITALEPSFVLVEVLDRSSDGQDPFGYSYTPLPDGGVVALGVGGIAPSVAADLVVVAEVVQFDADGAIVLEGAIQPSDAFTVSSAVASLTTEGELLVSLEDSNTGTVVQTVVDLVPLQDIPDPPPVPTEGDDRLVLTEFDDTVDALGGNDLISAGDGADWVIGGEGDDLIDGGAGDDLTDFATGEGGLYGGAGEDTIYGRDGADYLDGGAGNDDLRGGAGDESELGGAAAAGPEAGAGIYGGAGDDFIRGNHGDDDLFGDTGDDDLNGGFGADVLSGGDGDDKLAGFDGDDALFGDAGRDVLHGGRGNDSLSGDSDADTLRGAEGDDVLAGGQGNDLLIGGEGADRFQYFAFADEGSDEIKDFTIGEDKIELWTGVDGFAFEDLLITAGDGGATVVFEDASVFLKGIDADDLSEDDFDLI